MNPKRHGFRYGRSCLSKLLEHHNKILAKLKKSNNVEIYLDFAKAFDKVDQCLLLNKLKKSELMVKPVCGCEIFYQTDNNVLPSIE